jgi:hypothetical protein
MTISCVGHWSQRLLGQSRAPFLKPDTPITPGCHRQGDILDGIKDVREVALSGFIEGTMRAREGDPAWGKENFVLVRYCIRYQSSMCHFQRQRGVWTTSPEYTT